MNIEGYLETKIASYLINLYPYPRPIYLLKNAFTNNREEKRRGGDEELNEKGQRYAFYVNKFFEQMLEYQYNQMCHTLFQDPLKIMPYNRNKMPFETCHTF